MARADIMSKEFISDSESDTEMDQTFKAPSDFKKCDHLKKFPLDKLTKKSEEEVWLLNIPANLDISKLKTLPIDFKRTSSVTVEKQSYEIEQEKNKDNSNLVVMVPGNKRDSLKILTKQDKPFQFDKIFTVSESKDIPDINYKEVRTERENVPVVSGLITRHFATGYDAEDFGINEPIKTKKKESVLEENNETEEQDNSKKRHHHHHHKEESDGAPSKKKKKEKKDKKHKKDKKKENK
ncbi:similar to Saccharomyces cerevisiae YJL148W RPA34 RNA polymerase I subunit A34.5 [Maudiozyma saulgeensis]|uniref:Similar to Saccharomyces cerevisiae YJL148W RPA34 RNA polymerase I subunit A34.5 n=1 Tax=Maudiozyma saulgeensis TaxID=1789683 RepID=A0A1X7R0V7_9SACH|nr:similar to Saccharomyces cerevisiae YJL148W RPA34 RNA polymerase I subunit A34.5 [Kazachstania saulgeensis]